MRTLVDIPDEDIRWLDQFARAQGKSRAALVREAVASFRGLAVCDGLERGRGLWRNREDIGDGVEYQRRLRAECTRPWDFDHEEVKAEFPDLFDAEDDHERELYRR